MLTALKIVLVGGPDRVTESGVIPEVTDLNQTVKVAFASGYEHFRHNGEFQLIGGESRPVFEWCGRTKVAE